MCMRGEWWWCAAAAMRLTKGKWFKGQPNSAAACQDLCHWHDAARRGPPDSPEPLKACEWLQADTSLTRRMLGWPLLCCSS